jgi:hypothetical protein
MERNNAGVARVKNGKGSQCLSDGTIFCTAQELGFCTVGDLRKKLTRPDGCV